MVFSSHYTSTSLRPSCTVTVSGSPGRVLEIGFWASFLHKHIVLCTGCEYRGQEGVRLHSVVHSDSKRSAAHTQHFPTPVR